MTGTALWRQRRFATFWAAETVSQFGDRVSDLAVPLLAVLTLAATPTQVGLLTAAGWLPNLLSLLVGSWVDRQTHRRRLLIAADLLRAAALLSIPIAYWYGSITLAHLFAVALLCGLGQVLFSCAYASFFAGLVERPQYVEANSKLSTSRSASFVAGPALGGALIQALGAASAVLADAASFLFSALLIARIPVVVTQAEAPRTSLLADARAGLGYVLHHRYLRAALGCVTTVNFFTFIAQALVVLFASRTLGLPVGLLGLALGLGAVGGLLGAVLAPRLSHRYGVGRMLTVGVVLFPAPVAVIAAAGGPHWRAAILLGVAEALSGVGVMLLDINLNALLTAVTAEQMRSRMAGVFGTINYGVRPLGAAVGGLLGTGLGIRTTLLVAAVGGVGSCLWLLPSPIPRLRSLDDLPVGPDGAAVAAAPGAPR